MTDITPGSRYKHYKGGEYTVIGIAHIEAAPEELCVVYRMEYDSQDFKKGTLWIRPVINFTQEVTVDGVTRKRFEEVIETE